MDLYAQKTQRTLEIPRLLIAAPGSGHGKTTVMAGIAAALKEQGMRVATFKAGPDYLDPTYHAEASGQTCLNLDQWLMGRDGVRSAFGRAAEGCDIALIEGVMGLYDGLDPTSNEGSSWELSRTLQCPVVLVVDASGMARSVVPLVKGFREFDQGEEEIPSVLKSRLAGVIVNRIGSESHGQLLRRALRDVPDVEYLGGVRANKQNIFSERHLGLVSLRQNPHKKAQLAQATTLVKEGIDLKALCALAQSAPSLEISGPGIFIPRPSFGGKEGFSRAVPLSRCRIGVARDEAFDFYYDDNLDLLRSFGAELVFFSPLKDSCLPREPDGGSAQDLTKTHQIPGMAAVGTKLPAVDGLYFGGGYPELYAQELAQNHSMLEDIRAFGQAGGMIYGECGGFMYLCQTLQTLPPPPTSRPTPAQEACDGDGDKPGEIFPMVGLLPGHIVMHERLKAIGYVEVETQTATPLGPPGLRFRGHQFRYSERYLGQGEHSTHSDVEEESLVSPYRLRRRRDQATMNEGALFRNVLGSYVHAHWGSNPLVAQSFVAQCHAFRAQRHGILPQVSAKPDPMVGRGENPGG